MAVSNSVLELARGLKSQYGAGLPELLFKRLHLGLRKLMVALECGSVWNGREG